MRSADSATSPPHPSARQHAWSPDDVPEVVACTGPAEHYRNNFHDVLKLVLVPDAAFEVRRRGDRYEAGPGQTVALHAEETHSGGPELASGPPPGTEPSWLLLCLPRTVLADAGASAHPTFRQPVLPDPGIARDYRQLHRLLARPANPLHAQTALISFSHRLVHQADDGPHADDETGPRTTLAKVARDYLGDHLDRNVTLTELAGITGLSKFQVVRAFTRTYGLPPHTLQLRLRLDRAQDLLRQRHAPAVVAAGTGFVDQAHLTRAFRQTYGITPGRYRSNHHPSNR